MAVTVALAGDTMLGRGVAEVLRRMPPEDIVSPTVVEALRTADLTILNLECCVSTGGRPWPDPGKPFFFRAPPVAVRLLSHLGVDAVTLANNHALDFGAEALLDTLGHLADAGVGVAGAGPDVRVARRPVTLDAAGVPVRLVSATDHPADYAAGPHRPGVAYADLRHGAPEWLRAAASAGDAQVTLVSPHWGPNMVGSPTRQVREAADDLLAAGATVVAGHSAHVFHGVRLPAAPDRAVLYDLGDFLDDYAVDPRLRNDLGLVWRVRLEGRMVAGTAALPLRLGYGVTDVAVGQDRRWVAERLTRACAPFGTVVDDSGTWLHLRREGERA